MSKLRVNEICAEDDLHVLISQINRATWDEDNDISGYTLASMQTYLAKADTVFLACYVELGHEDTVIDEQSPSGELVSQKLVGIASGRYLLKPYGQSRWLYIDEVDTCSDYRRQGVGSALMARFLELTAENGCEEAWLATESDNLPAQRLYESFDSAEGEAIVGYAFDMSKHSE